MSFSKKLVLKDWNNRTHNTDILNLDESKFKGSLRNSKSNYARDGRIRRAQELRVDEFYVQKLRESHENNTKTHFTSTRNSRKYELFQ